MKRIFIMISIILAIFGTFFSVVNPNILAPAIYSILSDSSVYQRDAKDQVMGIELSRYRVGETPTSIDVSNFSEDSSHALVTNMEDSSVSVVNLDKGEVSRFYLPPGSKPRVSIFCDIDNDGRQEIIVPLWGNEFSSVFIGKVGRDFGIIEYDQVQVGYRPRSVACGDLDSDGFNEIISADNFSDTISIIDNLNGSLKYFRSIAVGKEPGAVTIVDFDQDGKLDIFVTHRGSNNAYLLLQKEEKNFKHVITFPTGKSPKDKIVADIDGDGDIDVVTVDGETKVASIFYMEGMTILRMEKVGLSGNPHAVKFVPYTHESKTGFIIIASYPNWVEVLRNCSGQYILNESHWFGWLGKQKILYLDFDSNNIEDIYIVMAGKDSLVKTNILKSQCPNES
jgi:hypothetical protein